MRSVSFDQFYKALRWRQGDHFSVIGPTGRGKSTLTGAITRKRDWNVALATKPEDATLRSFFRANGYKIARSWPYKDDSARNIALWPKFKDVNSFAVQKETFSRAISDIFRAGGWTVNADEAFYLTNILRLERELMMLWTQGRSLGLTVIASTQRPRHVPLHMFSQATHLALFKFADKADSERVAEIAGLDRKEVVRIMNGLSHHQFLYVNVVTGDMLISETKG